ncbi:MAG: outer membrane protein assembly factor BamD [Acidobacteria bacterium]|nr:outer membrane protein assembly factor BamD [Acidobacteriota bacterium]
MISAQRIALLLLPAAVLAIGCASSRNKEDELLDQLANLDKETIFEQAETLYSEKKYQEARELFAFVYDSFPNDPLGHKAALRVADTYSVKKDVTNLTEARLRYRDFANRYPNDPDRDYALLMVGHTYSARKLRPDRDLSDIHEALAAYEQLINLYPNSEYMSDAESRINNLKELLAEHEYIVGQFYFKNRRLVGALWRFQYIQENYPNFSKIETVNAKISELESLIEQRDAEWKKRLEELKKSTED